MSSCSRITADLQKQVYWNGRSHDRDNAAHLNSPVRPIGTAGNMAIQRSLRSDELDGGTGSAGPVDAGLPGGVGPSPAPVPLAGDAGAPAACARPIGWAHGPNSVDSGPDGIAIPISWQSSTGNLADLSNCQVREVVTYDPIPNPPFKWNPPNPTILTVDGTLGAGHDTHSYPIGLRTGITDPRVQGVMVAHQTYQWKCTAPGCPADWTDWPGETYDLTREVFPEFVRSNPWRYRITKLGTGAGNTFNASREVEVPDP